MRDEHYGHRNWRTGEPEGDREEWLDIDFALVSAYQTVEYYTDQNGIREWHKKDPEERIDAIRKFDPFQAGVDRITGGKNYKKMPGEYYVPEIKSGRDDESEMWTYQDMVDAEMKELLEKIESDKMVED